MLGSVGSIREEGVSSYRNAWVSNVQPKSEDEWVKKVASFSREERAEGLG